MADVREFQIRSEEDEHLFRRNSLRNALICLSIIKLCSITCYIMMFFMVRLNIPKASTSSWPKIIELMILFMILFIILFTLILAGLLFVGAVKENLYVLIAALAVAVILSTYDLLLGIIGAVYFIRVGTNAAHFILAAAFVFLALSFLPVFGNDWYLVYSFIRFLNS